MPSCKHSLQLTLDTRPVPPPTFLLPHRTVPTFYPLLPTPTTSPTLWTSHSGFTQAYGLLDMAPQTGPSLPLLGPRHLVSVRLYAKQITHRHTDLQQPSVLRHGLSRPPSTSPTHPHLPLTPQFPEPPNGTLPGPLLAAPTPYPLFYGPGSKASHALPSGFLSPPQALCPSPFRTGRSPQIPTATTSFPHYQDPIQLGSPTSPPHTPTPLHGLPCALPLQASLGSLLLHLATWDECLGHHSCRRLRAHHTTIHPLQVRTYLAPSSAVTYSTACGAATAHSKLWRDHMHWRTPQSPPPLVYLGLDGSRVT